MTAADNPNQARTTAATFVASVRPFDSIAHTDAHPLARVHFGRGLEFTGWQFVRHEHLHATTGHPLDYWEAIDAYATAICHHITDMTATGHLPAITDFAQLHDHFDANTGWGPEIDALPPAMWTAIQWRVTARLRWE